MSGMKAIVKATMMGAGPALNMTESVTPSDIRAISKAEEFLDANPGKKLYSLGAIVHNEAELEKCNGKLMEYIHNKGMDGLLPENRNKEG